MALLSLSKNEIPELFPPSPPVQFSSTVSVFGKQTAVKVPEAQFFQLKGYPKRIKIDGENWPPHFKTELLRSAKVLIPRDDDVFVCTYPKSGTTWIQHICSQLVHNNYGPGTGKGMGAKFADELPSPRLLKTHFNYQNCPKSSKAKYIYCVRNPKDCLVSYYFHNRNFKIYDWADGEFNVFFELFMESQLNFGDYFEHIKSWLPHVNDPNVLLLKYEDMLEDLETAVKKIGNFLGGRAAEIANDPESLRKVVSESKIDAMKENQTRWFPDHQMREHTFIRKGVKRDWKNYFSREQSDVMDIRFKTMFKDTIVLHWWKQEMMWDDFPKENFPEVDSTSTEPNK